MIKKYLKYFLALGPAALPLIVFGQSTGSSQFDQGMQSVGGAFPNQGISSSTSLNSLILHVIYILLEVTGAIAVLFVIIGGFWYITSAGNEEQAEKGQKTVINAIIGVVLVVLSYVIINVIANLVGNSGNGGY